jgi:hypothetical protein
LGGRDQKQKTKRKKECAMNIFDGAEVQALSSNEMARRG